MKRSDLHGNLTIFSLARRDLQIYEHYQSRSNHKAIDAMLPVLVESTVIFNALELSRLLMELNAKASLCTEKTETLRLFLEEYNEDESRDDSAETLYLKAQKIMSQMIDGMQLKHASEMETEELSIKLGAKPIEFAGGWFSCPLAGGRHFANRIYVLGEYLSLPWKKSKDNLRTGIELFSSIYAQIAENFENWDLVLKPEMQLAVVSEMSRLSSFYVQDHVKVREHLMLEFGTTPPKLTDGIGTTPGKDQKAQAHSQFGLNDAQRKAVDILQERSRTGKGTPIKVLCEELKKVGTVLTEETLRNHVIPPLKIRFDIRNDRNGFGYYIAELMPRACCMTVAMT